MLELRMVTRSRWLLLCLGAWLSVPSVMAVADECDFKTAIDKDDLVAIKVLLDRGCNPNLTSSGGETPLYQAAMNSQRKVTKLLLSRGADPRRTGNLPLRLAQNTDTSTMRMLLDHGMPVNYQDENGDTILLSAVSSKYSNTPGCNNPRCWHGYTAMVRFLLSRGANPNLRNQYGIAPIHWAIAQDLSEEAWILAHARGANLSIADNGGWVPLHLAARQGAVRLVQYLLSRGVDPNSADEGGNTPLHEVASALASSLAQSDGAYIEVAKLLIKAKAKVGAMDSAGSTPLHQAASLSSRDACERSASLAGLLVKAGAPVDGQDSDGETPLHHAAREDNADLVSLLLRNGADAKAKDKDGLTPLHWLGAFGQGCEPKVWARRWQTTIALLVGAGARLQDVDLAGRTPLWLATGRVFSQEIVKAFLAEGARAMDLGPRRASPLHFAAYLDEYGVAESLLGAGAAPTARDDSGLSPLHWAAVKGSNRTLALLLAKGADANTVDSSGRTPLDLAVLACQEKTVEVLRRAGGHTGRSDGHPLIPCPRPPPHAVDARLDKAASEDLQTVVRAGIPVDSRDHRGSTPLHLVARYSYLEADLRSLLGSKADPNARDDEGKTPLHFAAEDSREKISRLLLSAGADVNAKDVRGRTPLHMLQFRNDVQALTALLLQKGADPAVQDRLGRTALHAVSDTKDQRRDWVEYLMCHGGNPEVRDVLGWTVADLGAIRGWADTSPLHCSEAWQKADKPKSEPERPCLSY